jgi:hypothetical protein
MEAEGTLAEEWRLAEKKCFKGLTDNRDLKLLTRSNELRPPLLLRRQSLKTNGLVDNRNLNLLMRGGWRISNVVYSWSRRDEHAGRVVRDVYLYLPII